MTVRVERRRRLKHQARSVQPELEVGGFVDDDHPVAT